MPAPTFLMTARRRGRIVDYRRNLPGQKKRITKARNPKANKPDYRVFVLSRLAMEFCSIELRGSPPFRLVNKDNEGGSLAVCRNLVEGTVRMLFGCRSG